MTLAAGTALGPYQILSSLGAGGMGEVYRARDARLDRDVAIKILPELFAADPERVTRFQREAKTLASLNHQNIAHVYGTEQSGSTHALVMELVEGEDLAQRLQRGSIPINETLEIGRQVAEALETAHEQGIVHRDLKPANIKLRPDGTVKVLDFGLAKAMTPEFPSGDQLNSPTFTSPATQLGVILGTAAYMAPEQAKGKAVDRRADIWAFGVVLHEMLTGRRLWEGETAPETLAHVISRDVDLSHLPAGTPPRLRNLIARCLVKDPRARLRDIGEARVALSEVIAGGERDEFPGSQHPARVTGRTMATAATVVVAAVVLTAAVTWQLARPQVSRASPVFRADLSLGEVSFNPAGATNIALSPDGTRLVFAGVRGDDMKLFLRELDSSDVKPLGGTESSIMPFFSPDGQWIGFMSGSRLKKVPVSGGTPTTICEASGSSGAVWAPDDTIIFGAGPDRPLMRVPASGGTPTPFTSLEAGEVAHRWPSLLPDGGGVLFAAGMGGAWSDARIILQPLGGGPRSIVVHGGTAPQYAHSGHLIYARAGALFAVPFDPQRRSSMGTAREVASGILFTDADGRMQYGLSANGVLVAAHGSASLPKRQLMWVSRNGTAEPLPTPARALEQPRLSPDGRYVAVTIRESSPDIWVIDLSRALLSRFTFDAGEEESAIWTPDSRRITFSASHPGKPRRTIWKPVDGSAQEEELFTTPRHQHLSSWTPDGKTLFTDEVDPTWRIYAGTYGSKSLSPWRSTPFHESGAQVSPDGKWIVYVSGEAGSPEVYVQAYPGPGGRWQVSSGGGTEARWSPLGNEVFYRDGDRLMAVPITTQPTFAAGTPKMLFEGKYARMPWPAVNYDVSSDARRFLMVQGDDLPLNRELKLTVNWFEELKAVAPRAK